MKKIILFIALLHSTSFQAGPMRKELANLYPHLSQETMEKRFSTVSDPFIFHRSFVPFFFSRLRDHQTVRSNFQKLENVHGWCVGDAHPENFGVILNELNEVNFTVTDVDDGGPCPIYADFLRFLTGVLIRDQNFELRPILRDYLQGLSGLDRSLSHVAQRMLEESAKKGKAPPLSWLDPKGPFKFVRNAEFTELSEREFALVENVARIYFPDLQLRDAVRRFRFSGGSGGLERFAILFTPKKENSNDDTLPLILETT